MSIKPGDLVFFKSDGSWWDWFIHLVSPTYTHVDIVINDKYMVDASGRGVRLTDMTTQKGEKTFARVKGVSKDNLNEGLKYALIIANQKKKYGFVDVIFAGILRVLGLRSIASKINDEWFCSEIVFYIIREKYKVKILEGLTSYHVMPDELLTDHRVMILEIEDKKKEDK